MCTTKDHLFPYRTRHFLRHIFTSSILRSILRHSATKFFVPEYDTRASTVFQCLWISTTLSKKKIFFLKYIGLTTIKGGKIIKWPLCKSVMPQWCICDMKCSIFQTWALDGTKWATSPLFHFLIWVKEALALIVLKSELTSQMVWTWWKRQESWTCNLQSLTELTYSSLSLLVL